MLSAFRSTLETWPVRLLFLLLVIAFGMWGVGDMIRVVGHDTAVAKVAGYRIEMPQLQQAYQRQMSELTRSLRGGTEPTPEMRQVVADQAIERLVTDAAMRAEVAKMGVVLTDNALRQVTFSMPAFQGPGGQFDRNTFLTVLQRNGMDEAQFLGTLSADLADKQVLSAVRAGAVAPNVMARDIFQFRNERRLADAVELAFAAAPAPPAPTDAQLHRYWENHPAAFSTPEYRRIKAVILSPETLAKDMPVSDEELQAAYEQHKADFQVPEKRSVEIVLGQDEAKARALAQQWRGGADWSAMQAAAKQAGASSVQLDEVPEKQIPIPALAQAVFAAAPETVAGPIKTDLGWYVAKVTKVTPGAARSFDQAKEALRRSVAEQKAADAIYDRANKVEDALAGGSGLGELPGNLGLAAVTGTLDVKGNTPEGSSAPIPGPPELHSAIVAAAFQTKPGEPPHLVEVPGQPAPGQPQISSYYALSVEKITPPAVKPFDQVQDQVKADATRDAIRHEQEEAAAKILTAVKGGQSLEDAALKAGVTVRRLPPVGRQGNVEGVPPELVQPLFGLGKGQPTMVETPSGFTVAVLTDIQDPDPSADPAGYAAVREKLTQSIGNDLESVYIAAVRTRDKPHINRQMVDSLAQP